MPRPIASGALTALFPVLVVPFLPAQTAWTSLTPTGTPSARIGHGMAVDLANGKIVMFGGSDGVARQSDTWLLQGSTWSQATPAVSPPPRAAHQLAYDPARGRVVLFGGIGIGTGVLADTWEWDGATWTPMTPATVPPSRRSHALIHHPGRGTVVAWGGYGTAGDLNDMWEWNGLDWAAIVTANRPSPRRASDMAFDPVGGGVVLFSGYLQGADTWYFDGVDWALRTPSASPPARYDHTMATDLVRGRVVLFGGTANADTWEWDGATWIQRTPTLLPPGRYDNCLVYDLLADRVVMWGGIVGNPDLWEYRNTTPATYATFGQGCPGSSSQTPRLAAGGRPWLGETLAVTVDRLPAGAAFGFMVVGHGNTSWNGLPLPFDLGGFGMPGCPLLVDPAASVLLGSAGGIVTWNLALPNQPTLAGIRFHNQYFSLDPGANAAGVAVSNGGTGHTGMR